jgi:hypothetical protein
MPRVDEGPWPTQRVGTEEWVSRAPTRRTRAGAGSAMFLTEDTAWREFGVIEWQVK